MMRPLMYMTKRSPFSAFFSKKAGSGDRLVHSKTRESGIGPIAPGSTRVTSAADTRVTSTGDIRVTA